MLELEFFAVATRLRCARVFPLIGICLLALSIVSPTVAAPWADLPSDQTPDPAVRSGTLPNGVRYVIRPNAEPRDRVSLRLLVSAGSLCERDDERGLAHFIEHMAFRGTRNYPGNSLQTMLERRGLGLGADNAAFTGYDYTVYHLELPDTQSSTLRLGLSVFREYAEGITFPPEAIEKERGVVLSEKDTRNTPSQRLADINLRFLWPAARQSRRAVIGTEKAIRGFTRDQFVAFYDAWYRPERLAVIIVGDIATADVEPLVAEIFGSLRARAAARREPADIVPAQASPPDVGVYHDNSLPGVRFSFTHPIQRTRPPDTHAERVAQLHRALAFALFAKRLDWATRRRGVAAVAPTVTTETYLPGWDVVSFSAAGRIADWTRLAAELEQEHRRAYLLGFRDDELQLAKINFANNYEQAVRSAATRRSEYLAGQLEGFLLYGGVLVTPASAQRDLAADLAATTLQDCAAAFRSAWTGRPLHVLVATNPGFTSSDALVRDVLNRSRAIPVQPTRAAPPVNFAYTSFGRAGKIIQDNYLPDLDVHLARFANGVRLNFKSTPFEADVASVTVRVGTGKLSLPPDQPGLDLLAAYGFINGGVRRHSSEEFDALLSRHVLSVQFGVETDACTFNVRCARRELPLALQVVAAYLTDPAYRPEAMNEARAALGTLYSDYDATSGGAITFRAERVLSGGNPRIGVPETGEAFERTFRELAAWLNPQLNRGAIELSIVGDVTWPEATAAVGPTLAALHQRDSYPRPGRDARVAFATPSKFPQLLPLDGGLKQTALAWYWPVPDLDGVHQERRSRLLAAVMSELLFTRLREEFGATYTPAAEFVNYEGLPTFSYFALHADVAGPQGLQAAKAMRREIDDLRAKGIDAEVFSRARQPFLRSREEDLRSNSYWGYTVLRDAQLRPEKIAAARDRAADTAAITRGDLEVLARRYLDPARGFLFIAAPGPTTNWGARYLWDAK